jgi:hypothetical protein
VLGWCVLGVWGLGGLVEAHKAELAGA